MWYVWWYNGKSYDSWYHLWKRYSDTDVCEKIWDRYENKCKMAETEYSKILSELKRNLLGLQYDEGTMLSHLNEIDDMISSNCPSSDGVVQKYQEKYCDQTDSLETTSQLTYSNL